MKFILLLVFIVCAQNHELIKSYPLNETIKGGNYNEMNLWVYTIDGCEYIGPASFAIVQFLVHKGNCKFCTERAKASIKTDTTSVPGFYSPGYYSRYLKR